MKWWEGYVLLQASLLHMTVGHATEFQNLTNDVSHDALLLIKGETWVSLTILQPHITVIPVPRCLALVVLKCQKWSPTKLLILPNYLKEQSNT